MSALEEAKTFLGQVIEKMNVNASFEAKKNEEIINVEIEGEDAGILIGRDGQTLNALQLITNIAANKGQENFVHVLIDVEGYRDRQAENLKKIALGLAEKVAQEKRPISMRPANAFERRIVHLALRESTSVITESQGEGRERHIVIIPL